MNAMGLINVFLCSRTATFGQGRYPRAETRSCNIAVHGNVIVLDPNGMTISHRCAGRYTEVVDDHPAG